MIGSSKSLSGFDPRTIPGCQLWLDPANSSSLTLSGANVVTIADSSTTGVTATRLAGNSYATTTTISGNRILSFSSENIVYRSPMVLTGAAYTIFVIGSLLSGSGYQRIVNTDGSGGRIFIGANNGSFATFTGNNNFNDVAANTPGYTLTGAGLQLMSMVVSGSSLIPYINGTAMNTKTGTTGATTVLDIGAYEDGVTQAWKGYIGDIIVYNSALTTAQRQQVEGYLAHKWGLVPYYDSSIPLSIPGSTMWLDGADPAGTGVIPSDGTLATWVDKSGNGRNGVQFSTFTRPQFVANSLNSRGGVSFNAASSNCYQTQSVLPTPVTIFVVGFTSDGGFCLSGIPNPNSGHPPYYVSFARDVEFGVNNTSDTAFLANVSTSFNTNYILTGLYTGSDVSVIINGGTLSNTVSFSGTPKTPATTLIGLNSYANGLGAALTGTINEMITYNTALTTSQRQQVEGYLARKWGFTSMYSSVPSIHPFSSIRPHLRAFQPTDIDGCQLWLDGADASTVTLSGSNVSYWLDKSGNARDLGVGSGNTSYSSNAIVLNSSYMFVNSPVNLTNVTVFIVSKSTGVTNQILLGAKPNTDYVYNSVDGFGFYVDPPTGRIRFYGQGDDIRQSIFFTDTSISKLYTFQSTGTTVSGWLNGTSQSGGTLTTTRTSTAQGFAIGAEWGGSSYVNIWVTASIYEILVYNVALTTSQRQQVEGYLAHKWGLTLYLPVISPLSIPGCQMWLDGADPAGNGVVPSNGATVSTWVDKSGNGYNATAAPSRTAGTYSSSFRAVYFPTSTTGYITNYTAAPTNETMFVVFNNPTASYENNILIGGVQGARSLGAGYSGNGGQTVGVVGNLNTQIAWLARTNGGSYALGTTALVTSQFTTSTNTISINGGSVASGGAPGFTAGRVTYLGVDATNSFYHYVGYAMEILFYNSILSTEQRQQVEGYLARKWGITISATLPSLHPFKSIPPASLPFSPRNISGLSLWLDAADQSSMTLSGSSVTQWRDKSGNGLNVSAASSQPTYVANGLNNLGTLAFNGSQNLTAGSVTAGQLLGSTGTSATFCVFSVSDNTAGSCPISWDDGSYTYRYIITWDSSGIIFDLGNANAGVSNRRITIPNSTLTFVNNTYYLVSFWQSGGAALLNVNGGAYTATIASGFTGNMPTSTSRTFNVGSYVNTSVYNMKGNVAEILVYNSHIPNNFKQVEGYLAHKWGLVGSLPSSHPFKKLPA